MPDTRDRFLSNRRRLLLIGLTAGLVLVPADITDFSDPFELAGLALRMTCLVILISLVTLRRVTQHQGEVAAFGLTVLAFLTRLPVMAHEEPMVASFGLTGDLILMIGVAAYVFGRQHGALITGGIVLVHLVPAMLILQGEALAGFVRIALLGGFLVVALQQRHPSEHQEVQLAYIDSLTGLDNRRQMQIHLNASIARRDEGGGPDTLVLFDLDHFKQLNDTMGHQAGDRALQRVADVVRSHLRQSDVIARWGGEEFLVLLPDTGPEDGALHAERMRSVIEDTGVLTASFGVAAVRERDTITSWVRRTDLALYEAKQHGRNRVATSSVYVDPRPEVPRRRVQRSARSYPDTRSASGRRAAD